ncbi:MAG: hypothetical protein WB992_10495 [Bryobacteraceae bacterium]
MWHTLKTFGIYYQEVYSSTLGADPVCWIMRPAKTAGRYAVFYCNGHVEVQETRGSIKNARALAAKWIASYGA